ELRRGGGASAEGQQRTSDRQRPALRHEPSTINRFGGACQVWRRKYPTTIRKDFAGSGVGHEHVELPGTARAGVAVHLDEVLPCIERQIEEALVLHVAGRAGLREPAAGAARAFADVEQRLVARALHVEDDALRRG